MYYIKVETNSCPYNSINIGLSKIIEYIGNIKKPNSPNGPYAAGVEYLNKKLHKNNKTAINRLVYSSRIRTTKGNAQYTEWKIHAYKAVKIFNLIFKEISTCQDEEILNIATEIMRHLNKAGLPTCDEPGGAEPKCVCVASPFCTQINRDIGADNRSPMEIKYLKRISKSIGKFQVS